MKPLELGLINDDYLYDRVTGKVRIEGEEGYYPVKIYENGRIVSFVDDRFRGGEYEEIELEEGLLNYIKSLL